MPKAGDRFFNRDYASTLRTIASEGAESFYRGSLARRIAADMQTNDGLITYDDLAQYRAIERKPVTGRYRGHVLFTGGPPVSTGVSLLEAFQVLGNYTPKANATPATDAEYWHYLIESWKVRDRVARIADPAQWPVDFEEHLESMHAANLFNRIDSQRAQSFPEDSDEIGGGPERIGSGTSGFVVADVEGNVIAITQTLSTWGGSFYVSRGLGFLYNNHLRSNRTAPGSVRPVEAAQPIQYGQRADAGVQGEGRHARAATGSRVGRERLDSRLHLLDRDGRPRWRPVDAAGDRGAPFPGQPRSDGRWRARCPCGDRGPVPARGRADARGARSSIPEDRPKG